MSQPLRWLAAILTPAALFFLIIHAIPKLFVTYAVYGDYYWNRRFWLFPHVAFGLAATLLGPWQFVTRVRNAWPALHRSLGLLYSVAVALAAAAALYLAVTSGITMAYAIGLIVVASFWMGSVAAAYRAARRRRFQTHRRWMIRNYTTTLFFIIFFAIYDGLRYLDVASAERIATWGVWGCWILPLALVEWWLRVDVANVSLQRSIESR